MVTRIKMELTRRGLSIRKVSMTIGKSYPYMWEVSTGRRVIHKPALEALEKLLGIDGKDFFDEAGRALPAD